MYSGSTKITEIESHTISELGNSLLRINYFSVEKLEKVMEMT